MLTANPREGERLEFELSSADPSVTSYIYSFDNVQRRVDAVDGVATIGFDAVAAGPHMLQVEARDTTGNLSDRSDLYVFTQAIPALIRWRPGASTTATSPPGRAPSRP